MNRNKLKKDGNLIKTLNARHKRKRNKNTLKELAKSFLEYMKEENGKVLKIDDIVKKLEFSKRRIYDITNVLEGIGIIKKIEKNKIEIISKQSLDSESIYERVNSEMESLLDEEIELKKEEKKLDIWINELMNTYYENSKSEEFKKMCFLNLDHIKSIGDKKDLNIVGINAPKNTKIVVPDPNCLESLYNEKIKVQLIVTCRM
jgi:hypothetical protein